MTDDERPVQVPVVSSPTRTSVDRTPREHGRNRQVWLVLALLAAFALTALAATTSRSESAFVVKISNSSDTAGVAATNSCAWTYATGTPTPYFLYPLSDNPVTTTAADISGNNRTGAYTGTPAHSALNACTRDRDGTTTFNGTNTLLVSPDAQSSPQTLTLEIWFKTTVAGGYLIGLNNSKTGAGSSYDRHLYVNSLGNVVFGIYNGGTRTITSPATYTDGAWHHAVGTFSSTSGLILYMDGRSVGTPLSASYTAENNTGYWRIGYGNLGGWPSPPTNFFFTGQLGYAAVYLSVLTAATVSTHYLAGV